MFPMRIKNRKSLASTEIAIRCFRFAPNNFDVCTTSSQACLPLFLDRAPSQTSQTQTNAISILSVLQTLYAKTKAHNTSRNVLPSSKTNLQKKISRTNLIQWPYTLDLLLARLQRRRMPRTDPSLVWPVTMCLEAIPRSLLRILRSLSKLMRYVCPFFSFQECQELRKAHHMCFETFSAMVEISRPSGISKSRSLYQMCWYIYRVLPASDSTLTHDSDTTSTSLTIAC